MNSDLDRIYQQALRGDLDSLEELIPEIRRGSLSAGQYREVKSSLIDLKIRLGDLMELLERARQEWEAQDFMWARGMSLWHLQESEKRLPICWKGRGKGGPYDFIGFLVPRQRSIPEDALWSSLSEGQKGSPVCRECLHGIYHKNKAAFYAIREAFKERVV